MALNFGRNPEDKLTRRRLGDRPVRRAKERLLRKDMHRSVKREKALSISLFRNFCSLVRGVILVL